MKHIKIEIQFYLKLFHRKCLFIDVDHLFLNQLR